jgi:hypothetical protein
MVRSATLLIVMMLAGGPVGPLGCELWCTSAAAEDHHVGVGCQHASHTLAPDHQIASQGVCHAAALTEVVIEARQTESAPAAGAPLAPFDPGFIGPGDDRVAAGRYVFNVSPPRPPCSRAVLRV